MSNSTVVGLELLAVPPRLPNHVWLVGCWSLGLCLGLVSLARNALVKPSDELSVIRRSIALLGRLCVYSAVLAMPLAVTAIELDNPVVSDVTTFATTQSWLFGMGRPACAIFIGVAFGVAASIHPAIRWFLLCELFAQVVLDTLSESELHLRIDCLRRGLCTHVHGFNNTGMALLWARDALALVLEVWALVMLMHVLVVQGFVHNEFSHDQLSDTFNSGLVLNDNLERFALLPPREIQLRRKLRQL